jgi:hypothetical protein
VTSGAPPGYDSENHQIGDEFEPNGSGLGTWEMLEDPNGHRECAQERAIDNGAVHPGRGLRANLPRQTHAVDHVWSATEIEASVKLTTLPSKTPISPTSSSALRTTHDLERVRPVRVQ